MARYLYIHVPFCLKKCIYCDFLSIPCTEPHFQGSYVEALKKELRLRAHATPLEGIYIGGGTPTVLQGRLLSEIFGAIHEYFNIAPGPVANGHIPAEVTVEANPDTVDEAKLDILLECGVNRLSIGVQSLNDRELSLLGRTHTAAKAVEAVEKARRAGFANVSIDLMYGIPGQTLRAWQETLEEALELKLEHISAYELTPEKGTPLYDSIEQGRITMPDGDLAADMFDLTVEMLTGGGYVHYEISNYALPSYECRHNLNYWRRGEYTGAGAGAHSFENGTRFKNTGDINAYIELLNTGRSPQIEHEEADPVKEAVFLGLRTAEGLPLEEAVINDTVREFISEGLMEIKNNRLRLTRRGLRLYNRVVVELM